MKEELNITQSINMNQRKTLSRLQKNKQLYEIRNKYNKVLQVLMAIQKYMLNINILNVLI